jgi:glycosyltransferase involved in cell wall biosynthesis
LNDWLSRAAIYALPARYEPFGLSALEAALSGCALVLGDIPSLREVLGESALYVPPHDVDALRTVLNVLAGDPALRSRLGEAARRRALTYTPSQMAGAYYTAYQELLATSLPPTAEAAPCAL